MGEMKNAHKFIGKFESKRSFRRPRHRWENIVDLKEIW
jgi:hypothetical protein